MNRYPHLTFRKQGNQTERMSQKIIRVYTFVITSRMCELKLSIKIHCYRQHSKEYLDVEVKRNTIILYFLFSSDMTQTAHIQKHMGEKPYDILH